MNISHLSVSSRDIIDKILPFHLVKECNRKINTYQKKFTTNHDRNFLIFDDDNLIFYSAQQDTCGNYILTSQLQNGEKLKFIRDNEYKLKTIEIAIPDNNFIFGKTLVSTYFKYKDFKMSNISLNGKHYDEYNGPCYTGSYIMINELFFSCSENRNYFVMRINDDDKGVKHGISCRIYLEVNFNEHNKQIKNIKIIRDNIEKELTTNDFKNMEICFNDFLMYEQLKGWMFKKNILNHSEQYEKIYTGGLKNIKNVLKMLEGILIPVDQIPTNPTSYTSPAV